MNYMNDANEAGLKKERDKYFKFLKECQSFRYKNTTRYIAYTEIHPPSFAYLLHTDEKVKPIYTATDGYGKIHIWKENEQYNAGVEIENRYALLDDELIPKIRVYNELPEHIEIIIEKLDETYKISNS